MSTLSADAPTRAGEATSSGRFFPGSRGLKPGPEGSRRVAGLARARSPDRLRSVARPEQRLEVVAEPGQLLEVLMGEGQPGEERCGPLGQREPYDPAVVGVGVPLDEAGGDGAVHGTDGAVVADQQVLGHVADGGGAAAVAPDGQEELVLGRGQAHRSGARLVPAQERTEAVAELEQLLVLDVGRRTAVGWHRLPRTTRRRRRT